MTFEEAWDALCTKKPVLRKDESKIEFVPPNLKALLRQFWNLGTKANKGKSGSSIMDSFDNIFGGKM